MIIVHKGIHIYTNSEKGGVNDVIRDESWLSFSTISKRGCNYSKLTGDKASI